MPFTILHVGPALLVGLPLRRRLHLPTFLVASVAVDIEPLLVLILGLGYPLHSYLHTFLASLAYGLLIGYMMYLYDKILSPLFRLLHLEERPMGKHSFLVAGVIGTEIHVLLDSPLYTDIRPFYPLPVNPLYNPSLMNLVYALCLASWALGLILYIGLLPWKRMKQSL